MRTATKRRLGLTSTRRWFSASQSAAVQSGPSGTLLCISSLQYRPAACGEVGRSGSGPESWQACRAQGSRPGRCDGSAERIARTGLCRVREEATAHPAVEELREIRRVERASLHRIRAAPGAREQIEQIGDDASELRTHIWRRRAPR